MQILSAAFQEIGAGDSTSSITAFKIATGIYTAYAGTQSVLEATQIYGDIGRYISEIFYNITHPNILGKMIYYQEDFIK